MKRTIGQIWTTRINFLIIKAEDFSVQVNAKIQEFKTADKDTSQLEVWLTNFNQKLDLAKQQRQ